MDRNVVVQKSKAFAVHIVRTYQFLTEEKREYVMSKQLLRSGTSIGANIREAVQGFSKNDFIFKMSLALKESTETQYWLELMNETGYLTRERFSALYQQAEELTKLLTAIIKTVRAGQKD